MQYVKVHNGRKTMTREAYNPERRRKRATMRAKRLSSRQYRRLRKQERREAAEREKAHAKPN